mgnify:FL=1
MTQIVALTPFAPSPQTAGLTLEVALHRRGTGTAAWLELGYTLRGSGLDRLCWPDPVRTPERRDGLWQSTCCEAFLAVEGEEAYREVNLAPAGHWNLYQLSGYRRDLRPDPRVATLAVAAQRRPEALTLQVSLQLGALGLAAARLELGITAVLEHHDGGHSYWALTHPAAEPDFHHRGGFQLRLDP